MHITIHSICQCNNGHQTNSLCVPFCLYYREWYTKQIEKAKDSLANKHAIITFFLLIPHQTLSNHFNITT